MVIYNITSKVDGSIATEWLRWMQKEHIAEVLATGCFASYKIMRLLQTDETDGPTYAVQYYTVSISMYEKYSRTFAASMQKKITSKWGDRYIDFHSLMQEVEQDV